VLVRTDDEVYRVDSVWLGPPRATFPWRARYVSYGVGLLVMIAVMFVQRRLGIGLDFFSIAWSLIFTVLITRFLGKRIDYERPLGQVAELFRHEVTGPRRRRAGAGGPVRFAHVRTQRILPAQRGRTRPGAVSLPQVTAAEPPRESHTGTRESHSPPRESPVEPPALPQPAPAGLRDITPVRATPQRVRPKAEPAPWATAAERKGRHGRA
jgi:hypothetical protein